jgi:hypothetical protein
MNRGRLIALDTAAGLRTGMTDLLLEILTNNAPRAVEALRGTPGVIEVGLFGRTVHVTVSRSEGAALRVQESLRARGLEVTAVTTIMPSLEDVFIARVAASGGAPTD